MIKRKEYLEQLLLWKNENIIKVVTGLRRCGKSTLLGQYQDILRADGVTPEQIISINFEELENEPLQDYQVLYAYIKERLCPDKMTYVFLDEVQKVGSYEKVVDSLYVKPNVDIYITGSNAYMLSSDLATLLSGRYVEISMLPFSFREYCEATGGNGDTALADYMRYGGLPYIATMDKSAEKAEVYLEGIYNTVIVKDIEERAKRRETDPDKRKITDITLLKTIARYLAGVIGSPVSVKGVSDYLTSSGRKVSANTVDDYMDALRESFVFYPIGRFDIAGKQTLKTNQKWYMVDLGLRNHLLPKRSYDLGFSLENIVCFELLRRGYRINIGKLGSAEVDFIARKENSLTYFQVTADMTSKDTFEREMAPFKKLKDHYPKVVLTLDRFTPGDYDGIQVVNLVEWLG